MEEMELGPNGGLVFCMELLLENSAWLKREIEKLPNKTYLMFDFPGQAELYSVHNCVEKLIQYLTKELDIRLCALYFTEGKYFYVFWFFFESKFITYNLLRPTCVRCAYIYSGNVGYIIVYAETKFALGQYIIKN